MGAPEPNFWKGNIRLDCGEHRKKEPNNKDTFCQAMTLRCENTKHLNQRKKNIIKTTIEYKLDNNWFLDKWNKINESPGIMFLGLDHVIVRQKHDSEGRGIMVP